MADPGKFLTGTLVALSTMLELSHLNVRQFDT
jgi:hypothetical protein